MFQLFQQIVFRKHVIILCTRCFPGADSINLLISENSQLITLIPSF